MFGLYKRLLATTGSLKLRLTLGTIAALVLGIGLVTLLLVQQAERDTLAAQRDRELADTVRLAAIVAGRVADLQQALRLTGARLDAETLRDPARLDAFVQTQPVLRSLFSSLFATMPDGRMLVLADAAGLQHPDRSVGDRAYFRRTMNEGRPLVSEPVASRVSPGRVIVFTQPLRDAGGIYGVLGGALRLEGRDLLGDLVEPDSGSASGRLLVVTDADGQVLAHPDRGRLLAPLATEPRLADAHAHWRAAGAPVSPTGIAVAQRGEVVTAAGIPGPGWVMWRSLPERDLLAPLTAARNRALAWSAGLVLLVSIGLVLMLRRLLGPLAQLEKRAQHLFDGRHDPHEGWPDSADEVGRLARVLRHVAAERAQLEAFNSQVLDKLGSVMSAAPVGIAFTRHERFELVSDELCRLLGRAEQDLLGQPAHVIFAHEADHAALGRQVRDAFATGGAYVGEWEMRRAGGQCFWAQLRGRPVDPFDAAAGAVWAVSDVTEHVMAREQLEWSAHHDALTGLANRKAFEQRLLRIVDARPRSLPTELVMIDLDHFKPINDQAGHAAGDAMLKAVAAAITANIRATDMAARIGGDEFALILERCNHGAALRVASNVQQAIMSILLPWDGKLLDVGASLGVASLLPSTRSAQAWLESADAACYAAKAAGRNAVRAAQATPRAVDTAGPNAAAAPEALEPAARAIEAV